MAYVGFGAAFELYWCSEFGATSCVSQFEGAYAYHPIGGVHLLVTDYVHQFVGLHCCSVFEATYLH